MTAILDCGIAEIHHKGIAGYERMYTITNTDDSTLLQSIQAKHAFQDQASSGDGGLIGAGVGTRTIQGNIASKLLETCKAHEEDERQDWVKHFYHAYDSLQEYKNY